MLGFDPISKRPISDIDLPTVSGTIYATDGTDTAVLSGAVAITGSISATDGTDTCTIYAQELVSGYIYTQDSNDTDDFEGSVAVSGTISATDGTDTVTITAQALVSGSISATDGADTCDIEGAVRIDDVIYAVDSNDTCNIQATVLDNMDMHDGFTRKDIERARALDKKLRKLELERIAAVRADAENRKKAIRGLIDPPVVKPQQKKQNKLQLKQEVTDTPSDKLVELDSRIATLEKQKQDLLRAVELRKQVAQSLAYLAILDAKAKAEQDEEEAILLLL